MVDSHSRRPSWARLRRLRRGWLERRRRRWGRGVHSWRGFGSRSPGGFVVAARRERGLCSQGRRGVDSSRPLVGGSQLRQLVVGMAAHSRGAAVRKKLLRLRGDLCVVSLVLYKSCGLSYVVSRASSLLCEPLFSARDPSQLKHRHRRLGLHPRHPCDRGSGSRSFCDGVDAFVVANRQTQTGCAPFRGWLDILLLLRQLPQQEP